VNSLILPMHHSLIFESVKPVFYFLFESVLDHRLRQ